MTYDKIILVVILFVLACVAALAEYKKRIRIQEGDYVVDIVNLKSIHQHIDVKNGTTYEKTYQYADGKEVTVIERSSDSSEKIRRLLNRGKCKIYRNQSNREDIQPYKNYIPLVVGSIILMFAELYIELI